MAKLCPLFSGSTGNSTYISVHGSAFLVDAGMSARRILCALDNRGLSAENIRGIFITHEHSDHVSGLKVLAQKLGVPVIASAQTLEALESCGALPPCCNTVAAEEAFELSGIRVTRFPTSHDCVGSSGYRFDLSQNCSVAVCTDLGVVTQPVLDGISGCRGVLIESNHDIKMLKTGPYPYELKLRIASEHGHLSNNACAAVLPELLKSGTTRFILGHLSRNNNRPELAESCAAAALMDFGAVRGSDYLLCAADGQGAGELPL